MSKIPINVEVAISLPSTMKMAAPVTPLSSFWRPWRNKPTVEDIGLDGNCRCSYVDGKGSVIYGKSYLYLTLISSGGTTDL